MSFNELYSRLNKLQAELSQLENLNMQPLAESRKSGSSRNSQTSKIKRIRAEVSGIMNELINFNPFEQSSMHAKELLSREKSV